MFENLAVVGATGAVGRIVLEQIHARQLPIKNLKLLASSRSAGTRIKFGDCLKTVELLRPESFDDVDLVIASTPDEVSAEFAPWATARGAVVVDESGFWRMDAKVPLVIPEVNPAAIQQHQGIIASPNCSTTQMVLALAPFHRAARVRRVVVSTYQATSGAGLAGSAELEQMTNAALDKRTDAVPRVFQHDIAFNLIPQIGSEKYEGYTSEEMKMVEETRKILGDATIQVCPTCVRVPVMIGHSESILVETEQPLSLTEARQLLSQADGITVIDELSQSRYPTPVNCVGSDQVLVGRIRKDLSSSNGIAFWCVSDNLRKGAATNAVQIAELLLTQTQVTA